MFFVVGAAVPYILWAITKNGYTRSGSRKRVQSKSKWKTHPTRHHAIDWSRAYRTRLLALFWGKTTHRYTCRRLIIYFDVSRFSLDGSSLTGIRSGQDRGVKAPEEFCGGKRVFFTWSRCLPVLFPILSTDSTGVVVMLHGSYVWICGRTSPGAHDGWIE